MTVKITFWQLTTDAIAKALDWLESAYTNVKSLESQDFKTVARAIRDPNKPEIKQPKIQPKISRETHTLRLKRGDNQK